MQATCATESPRRQDQMAQRPRLDLLIPPERYVQQEDTAKSDHLHGRRAKEDSTILTKERRPCSTACSAFQDRIAQVRPIQTSQMRARPVTTARQPPLWQSSTPQSQALLQQRVLPNKNYVQRANTVTCGTQTSATTALQAFTVPNSGQATTTPYAQLVAGAQQVWTSQPSARSASTVPLLTQRRSQTVSNAHQAVTAPALDRMPCLVRVMQGTTASSRPHRAIPSHKIRLIHQLDGGLA